MTGSGSGSVDGIGREPGDGDRSRPRLLLLCIVLWAFVVLYGAMIYQLSSGSLDDQPSTVQEAHERVNRTVSDVGGEGAERYTPDVEHVMLYTGFGFPVAAAMMASAALLRTGKGDIGAAGTDRRSIGRRWMLRLLGLCLLFIFVYAVTDEYHQMLVPGRQASPWDVLLDTLGGALGSALMLATVHVTRGRMTGGYGVEDVGPGNGEEE